ncbi:Alpha-1,3-mannosyl-glycoprotein 2-beta-N-acetylglucosaminyltransferase [Linum perenne]
MAKMGCDFRYLLLPAALLFIYVQMRLFTTQSEYADRLASAIESESHCTSQMKLLIDQISSQQGRIVALEGFILSTFHLLEMSCFSFTALLEKESCPFLAPVVSLRILYFLQRKRSVDKMNVNN